MNNKIIKEVKEIHKKFRSPKESVSQYTISAQTITKKWQEKVCEDVNIKSEVKVSNENNEKIDVVDCSEKIAYELKVSGKNPHHEFYKDLVKVLTYNLNYKDKKLKKFIFITEENGIESLNKRLDEKFLEMIKDKHNISIKLVKVNQNEQ